MMQVLTVTHSVSKRIAWMLFLKVYDAKEQDWDMDEADYQSIDRWYQRQRYQRWGHHKRRHHHNTAKHDDR